MEVVSLVDVVDGLLDDVLDDVELDVTGGGKKSVVVVSIFVGNVDELVDDVLEDERLLVESLLDDMVLVVVTLLVASVELLEVVTGGGTKSVVVSSFENVEVDSVEDVIDGRSMVRVLSSSV